MISRESTTYFAAKACVAHGIPFALCFKPGVEYDANSEFYVENPADGFGFKELSSDEFEVFDGFVVSLFKLDLQRCIFGIRSEKSASEILEFIAENPDFRMFDDVHLPYKSTSERLHKLLVMRTARTLNTDSEKIVLSRIFVDEFSVNPIDAAFEYFQKHISCFRYVMSLPNYGIWFGATPELLLDYNRNDFELATMSLAGTRSIYEVGEWDCKNTLEHNIVTEYICNILKKYELSVDMLQASSVKFNKIEHLCHLITAHGDVAISKLLPDLSPTPAVCGWPRENAYHKILESEDHKRLFYGGFVGTTSPDHSHIFVNLRSAYADLQTDDSAIYTLFAGGGITRHSNSDEEWVETEMKLQSLLTILKRLNSN